MVLAGLPDYSWCNVPKRGEICYLNNDKMSECPKNIPTNWCKNIQNSYQILYIYVPTFSIQRPTKNLPKFGFLVRKYIYHPATLLFSLIFDDVGKLNAVLSASLWSNRKKERDQNPQKCIEV
jgi:hypothetical protein